MPQAPWGLPRIAPTPHAAGVGLYPMALTPARPNPRVPAALRPGGLPPWGGSPGGGLVLMALVAGSAAAIGKVELVIDSGATHHMTPTATTLLNVRDIEPLNITMAGGKVV